MNHNSHTLCSVCSQAVATDRSHKCTEKFYSLITQIIQVKGDTPSFLDNITNLVFQGGGVKGLAYLGALEQLQAEGRLRNRDFLSGVKRIAGTSAGSMVALYLGLNMDVDKEIRPLMEKEYSELLDDGLVLKVAINPGGITIFGQTHKNFKVKHIILQALEYFAEINRLLKTGNTQAQKEAEEDLKKAINRLFGYYGTKVGIIPAIALKIKASSFAADATKWLLSLLKPPPVKKTSDLYREYIKRGTFPSYAADPYGENFKTHLADQETDKMKRSATAPLDVCSEEPPVVEANETGDRDEFGNDALDYASTKMDDTILDDIIENECSGFLTESDLLDISLSVVRENAIAQAYNNSGSNTTHDILKELAPNEFTIPGVQRGISNSDHAGSVLGNIAQNNGFYNEPAVREYLTDSLKSKRIEIPIITRENREGQNNYLNSSLYGTSPAHIDDILKVVKMQAQQQYKEMSPIQNNNIQQSNGGLIPGTIVGEEGMPAEKQTTVAKELEAEEYIKRNKGSVAAAPKEELTREVLPYALGELLWFCIISQQNAAGVQEKLGLFDGSVVTKELIEKPIADRLKKVGLEAKKNITFKELMECNASLSEEKKFKKFYVTAFNTETSKTEVFSAEHTPNVVIADAIRASMSIPVFFTPVTIRERNSLGQLEERKYHKNVVNYMDGGVLDNYPMWIFDDIKYCFDESFPIPSNMRCSIQNPNTLGFRLLDDKTIEKYTNPRLGGKVIREKEDKKFQQTFSYQMGLLAGAYMSEAQENEHLKRGDCTRSVYVDYLGVSSIKFSLSKPEKANLIESGRQSVRNYKSRAAKNFNGEGQLHH